LGDIGRRTLAKTDEHALLRVDVLHAETRASSVVPLASDDRLEPFVGRDARDARERVLDDLLLEAHLRRIIEVLQRATAATAEDLAGRRHARSRRLDDTNELGLGEPPALAPRR